MKQFISFLMMVLFVGAFTGFGNTITDLAKNSEKVTTVSADDFITVDVVSFNMVNQDIFIEQVSLPDKINLNMVSYSMVNNKFSQSFEEADQSFNKIYKEHLNKIDVFRVPKLNKIGIYRTKTKHQNKYQRSRGVLTS
jgi:hypothetical protein